MTGAGVRVKLLWSLAVGLVGVGTLLATWIVVAGLGAKPGLADVAIVFGNTVERSGKPSARLRARLEAARKLYSSGLVRRIIVTGGVGREGFDESLVMQGALVHAGIPAQDIYADGRGLNTALSCANARAYMASQGMTGADVVTQYFHIVRASMACRRAGIRVAGASAPRYFELRDLYSVAREVVALPAYALGIRS